MKTVAIVFLFSLAFVSCQKLLDPVETGDPELTGNWINPQYSDTLVTYSKADELIENELGISFNSDNTLVERKINGWCGTPPITTADYEGTWTRNDSIVKITVGYWGGSVDNIWKIITLDNQKLVISVVKSEYHEGK
jgi:hypothetical protein